MLSYNQAIGGSNATVQTDVAGDVGSSDGGALFSEGYTTVSDSHFDHNDSLGGSGNVGGGGVLAIGTACGGAISSCGHPRPGTLTIDNRCTFTNNRAIGAAGPSGSAFAGDGIGGGVCVGDFEDKPVTAAISNSTFANNQAIGGFSAATGADGLGGSIANINGSTLTLTLCSLIANSAVGGTGATGGNGFGGGLFNDGSSNVTILGSTITLNMASGGTALAGGNAGLGVGGGLYLVSGGTASADLLTLIIGNHASTSNDDVWGVLDLI